VVDDLLCRGTPEQIVAFHDELEGPDGFECGENSRQILTVDSDIDYCGLNLSTKVKNKQVYYSLDQIDGLVDMLTTLGLDDEPVKSSLMPSIDTLLPDTSLLNESDAAWCKSALGQLHYYARGTRWDMANTVSLMSQYCAALAVGAKLALKYLAGYLNGTLEDKITVIRSNGPAVFIF
jgi:hypothetical protein